MRRSGTLRRVLRHLPLLVALCGAVLSVRPDRARVHAQEPQTSAPRAPRAAAPIDLTGYWVAVVTEEWLWRMTTPQKGDYTSIPLSDAGRQVANDWDPATDGSCKAYGAVGLMHMPTRLHITWDGDSVLKVESDAGAQTRLLRFDRSQAPGARSLQGHSTAEWEPIGGPSPPPVVRAGRGVAPVALAGGALKVATTNLSEGWLRKNGVAYSERTSVQEYWDRTTFPNGDTWLIVTAIVNDPVYLVSDYTTSMHFKREPDGAKWKPSACKPSGQAEGQSGGQSQGQTPGPTPGPALGQASGPTPRQGQTPAAAREQPQMVDLAGSWAMSNDEELLIRIDPGPELGNFTGFPLNAAGRQKALTWNSTIQALPEHQARPHPVSYSMRGPGPNFHMGEIIDPVSRRLIGYTITGLFENANRTIWLDGRPHPSEYAEHLWSGFSTGVWENGMLKVTTTHMKQMFLQRNGIPVSPYAVMTEFLIRHGTLLMLISQVDDPIYLEEPMVRTSTWRWNPGQREQPIGQVEIAEELPDLKLGDVPSYPLGTRHPEYAEANKLPFEATLGGKETLYPEYLEKLRQLRESAKGTSR